MLGLVLVFLGLVSGKKIHEFYAEHNFICNACQDIVSFGCSGGDLDEFKGCYDETGKEYTDVCLKARNNVHMIQDLCQKMESYEICELMDMCGDWIDEEFDRIPAYEPEIVYAINNDSTSTWKAELPERFKLMTIGDVRRTTTGSVVDNKHTYKLNPDTTTTRKAAPSSFDSRTEWFVNMLSRYIVYN